MLFSITLLSLLIERFVDVSRWRTWQSYSRYCEVLAQRFSGLSPYVLLAMQIMPPIILVSFVNGQLAGVMWGFLKLFFNCFILISCLGPKNFWLCNKLELIDDASQKVVGQQVYSSTSLANSDEVTSVRAIFIRAYRSFFAVLFWYVLLGPTGALLYRLVVLRAMCAACSVSYRQGAENVLQYIDWLPVRIFSFIFALGGNFVRVIKCWQQEVLKGSNVNENLLADCGIAAIVPGITSDSDQGNVVSLEKEAYTLLNRALIISLVFFAVIVLYS